MSENFQQLQRYDVLETSPSSSYPGIQERTVEHIVDTSTLQSQDEIVEVTQLIPQEGISEPIFEQIVEVPVPPMEERQNRTVEQIVDVSIPQIQEETSPNQKYLAKSLCLAWLCWC